MIKVDGLAELVATFPDEEWRELRILIRKRGDAAEVEIVKEIRLVNPRPKEFLDQRVDSLDFGHFVNARIRNVCLNNVDHNWPYPSETKPIVTVADLIHKTEAELLREPNCGRRSVDAIKRVLAEHGLSLAPSKMRGW